MRLWSIHPKYLDSKGLVALWRETLLAKNVLQGKTKGYNNHPQLDRFKNQSSPTIAVNSYLNIIYKESLLRRYNFDKNKIDKHINNIKITVTFGQIKYEFNHLLKKLKERDLLNYNKYKDLIEIEPNPIFTTVPGEVESWERV